MSLCADELISVFFKLRCVSFYVFDLPRFMYDEEF